MIWSKLEGKRANEVVLVCVSSKKVAGRESRVRASGVVGYRTQKAPRI